MEKSPLYFTPTPVKCDVGHELLGETMYDAKTKMGPWGTLCEECFRTYGIGLGTGRGQKYQRQVDGRYLCVEGR